MRIGIFLLFSFLLSCSGNEKETGLQRRNLEEYFVSTGVVRYFLPDLPAWANFSDSASCFRDQSIRYFDLNALRNSFSLSYEQSIQLQLLYNWEAHKKKKLHKVDHIPFKEEEKLFFTQTDRIQAGIRVFRSPKFKRVHLIWIDPYLSEKKPEQSIKKVLAKSEMAKGHPVLVSKCLSHAGLNSLLVKASLANQNIRLIGQELFSPFDIDGKKVPGFILYFNELFQKDQKLYFYSRNSFLPKDFRGKFIKRRL